MDESRIDEIKRVNLCLTLVEEWSKTLKSDKDNDLKEALYIDLINNGVTLYQEVIVDFCAIYNQPEKLKQLFNKTDSKAFVEYFSQVNEEFTRILRFNVRTFHDSHNMQIKQPIGLDQLDDPSNEPRLQNDSQIEMQDEGLPDVPSNAGESSDSEQEDDGLMSPGAVG